MAKSLPEISLTDAQYARVAKVIPGTTAAQKVAAYETMVKDLLRNLVIEADVAAAREAAWAAVRDAEQAARDNAHNV